MTEYPFIPFNRPSIGEEEEAEVLACLRSGWLTTGPRTRQFELEFAKYVGAPHSLAVNSCTAALHLALSALDIGVGDEVITTPMTFCATVNTILEVGATPILADIRADGNIDPDSVASRITSRTKAIVPVHLAGLPCEMESLWELARRHNLLVVEDAAHAVGSLYKGVSIGGKQSDSGNHSDAVAFSFYATKNLTTGEGGMLTTHSQELMDRMRVLCLHGISKDAWNRYADRGNWYYEVEAPGYKYNLSDIQSSIGIHQLRRQEEFISRRQEIARQYTSAFAGLEELTPPSNDAEMRHCWHLYILKLNLDKLGISRSGFIEALREYGVGSSVHFIPIPLHPAYREWAAKPVNACPKALELYERIVSLPLYPAMREGEVQRVIDAVRSIVTEHRLVRSIAAETA